MIISNNNYSVNNCLLFYYSRIIAITYFLNILNLTNMANLFATFCITKVRPALQFWIDDAKTRVMTGFLNHLFKT